MNKSAGQHVGHVYLDEYLVVDCGVVISDRVMPMCR